jgi:hypothetical protein
METMRPTLNISGPKMNIDAFNVNFKGLTLTGEPLQK